MSQTVFDIKWGEELFYRKIKNQRARSISGLFTPPKTTSNSLAQRRQRVAKLLALTVKRTPEVMVKISGAGKGMYNIKAHFDYISRNGEVELENENGDIFQGSEILNDLKNEWKYGLYGIPEVSIKRESFNIVLSMPPGTDRNAVKCAAREFAAIQFSENHQYVFAAHEEERHPHVHLCVKALGIDGTRLNPRKADLQVWRELFAEKLRDNGIEANATSRRTRGILKENQKQTCIHAQRRCMSNKLANETLNSTKKLNDKQNKTYEKIIRAYKHLAHELAFSSHVGDRKLAVAIVDFVKQMPAIHQLMDQEKILLAPIKKNVEFQNELASQIAQDIVR